MADVLGVILLCNDNVVVGKSVGQSFWPKKWYTAFVIRELTSTKQRRKFYGARLAIFGKCSLRPTVNLFPTKKPHVIVSTYTFRIS